MLAQHAAEHVEKIRADHLVRKVRLEGRIFRTRVCSLCGQPAPCQRLRLADDIEAGRRDITGRPL